MDVPRTATVTTMMPSVARELRPRDLRRAAAPAVRGRHALGRLSTRRGASRASAGRPEEPDPADDRERGGGDGDRRLAARDPVERLAAASGRRASRSPPRSARAAARRRTAKSSEIAIAGAVRAEDRADSHRDQRRRRAGRGRTSRRRPPTSPAVTSSPAARREDERRRRARARAPARAAAARRRRPRPSGPRRSGAGRRRSARGSASSPARRRTSRRARRAGSRRPSRAPRRRPPTPSSIGWPPIEGLRPGRSSCTTTSTPITTTTRGEHDERADPEAPPSRRDRPERRADHALHLVRGRAAGDLEEALLERSRARASPRRPRRPPRRARG